MPHCAFDSAMEQLESGLLEKITECIRHELEQASRPCGGVEERASGTPRNSCSGGQDKVPGEQVGSEVEEHGAGATDLQASKLQQLDAFAVLRGTKDSPGAELEQ